MQKLWENRTPPTPLTLHHLPSSSSPPHDSESSPLLSHTHTTTQPPRDHPLPASIPPSLPLSLSLPPSPSFLLSTVPSLSLLKMVVLVMAGVFLTRECGVCASVQTSSSSGDHTEYMYVHVHMLFTHVHVPPAMVKVLKYVYNSS